MQVAEGTRFVGIDLGKRTYVVRVILPNGKVTGWNGTTDEKGRKELFTKLRASDKVSVEAFRNCLCFGCGI